jgi:hypothetical protein
MTKLSALGRGALLLTLAAACSSDEADATDSGEVRPDTSAIQGAGTVPSPPPGAVDSLRDTAARRKTP